MKHRNKYALYTAAIYCAVLVAAGLAFLLFGGHGAFVAIVGACFVIPAYIIGAIDDEDNGRRRR